MYRKQLLNSILTIIVLGLAVHMLLPQIAEFRHSMNVIKNMSIWLIALAFAMQFLSYVGSGYMLRSLVKITGQQLSVVAGIMITLASSSIGLVAGGILGNAASTYRWLHAKHVDRQGALLAGWLPSFFNNVILVLLSFSGVFHLLVVHELSTVQFVGFGLTLAFIAAIMGVAIWGMYYRSEFTAILGGIAHRWASLRKHSFDPSVFKNNIVQMFQSWDLMLTGGWHGPVIGSVLNIMFDALTLYFLFIAAGHKIGFGVLATGYGLPLLLGKISFLPGGVGIVESTMAVLYKGLGVPNAVIVVVVLAYRIVSFWMPTLLGFPLAFFLQRQDSE